MRVETWWRRLHYIGFKGGRFITNQICRGMPSLPLLSTFEIKTIVVRKTKPNRVKFVYRRTLRDIVVWNNDIINNNKKIKKIINSAAQTYAYCGTVKKEITLYFTWLNRTIRIDFLQTPALRVFFGSIRFKNSMSPKQKKGLSTVLFQTAYVNFVF